MQDGQASSTARVIAAATVLLASDARTAHLVAPGAAELCRVLLATNARDRWLVRSGEFGPTRALWRVLEKVTLPGIMQHYWNRKRCIEAWCRGAVAEGFTRLVVVGAGLDTLGFRLAAAFPQLEAVEIDHPATQGAKRHALQAGDVALPDNLRFVACDLAVQPLPLPEIDDGQPAIVVMEGLLMYLRPAEVDRLFASLRATRGRPLRVVFSAMAEWPDGRRGFRTQSPLIDRWLAQRGEPLQWYVAPQAVAGFLAERGFEVKALLEGPQMGDRELEGENLVMCEPLA